MTAQKKLKGKLSKAFSSRTSLLPSGLWMTNAAFLTTLTASTGGLALPIFFGVGAAASVVNSGLSTSEWAKARNLRKRHLRGRFG